MQTCSGCGQELAGGAKFCSVCGKATDLEKPMTLVAGFWIRLVSDALDAILLGIFGFCLSLPFRSALYRLGENGVWIGLCVTFLYAGILQSGIGQGQSLAKRLFKIQVLTMSGGYLPLWMSFLRYSVIALLFYYGWIWLAMISALRFLNNPVAQTIFGVVMVALFAGTVLMVPFHPLKRGLHDLICGSVVVYKGTFHPEALAELYNSRRARRSYIIAGASGLAITVAILILNQKFTETPAVGRLLRAQGRITNQTSLRNVSVALLRSFGAKSNDRATTLMVNGFLTKSSYDESGRQNQEAQKAAVALMETYGSSVTFDGISVNIRTGYNIGIASFQQSRQHLFDRQGSPIRNP